MSQHEGGAVRQKPLSGTFYIYKFSVAEFIMIAYFDCFSGISGDMTLGAFIDLGVPVPWLKENLAALPLAGFDLTAADVEYNGIHAKRVEVVAHGHAHRDYAAIRRFD